MASFLQILWENIRQCAEYVVQLVYTWFSDKMGRCRTEDEFVTAEQTLSDSSNETLQWVTAPIDEEEPQYYTLEEMENYRTKIFEFLSDLNEGSCDAEDRILFLMEEGHFHISLNVLGQGGFAQVREALFRNQEGNVSRMAVKVLNPQKHEDLDYTIKSMATEVAILRLLCTKASAANIIQVFGIIASRNSLFVLMQLAERGSVDDYITKFGALKGSQCKTWFGQVSRGLCYLHHLGIAHKDMKCDNILVTQGDILKICDFGCSEFCHDGTLSDNYVGSPGYVAPEVTLMTPHDAKAADIWSMGMILHMFLHRYIPFRSLRSARELAEQPSFFYIWKEIYQKDEALYMEEGTVQFLFQLLDYQPEKRLTIEEVCCNTWIQQMGKPIIWEFSMQQKLFWHIPVPSSETMSSTPAIPSQAPVVSVSGY